MQRDPVSPEPFRVLMVCTGNICRSPMAQVVLRDRLHRAGLDGQVEVDSAGVSDEEIGNPIDPRAGRVLAEAGYAVPEHRAHQVGSGELARYDLVLAMTDQHARALRRRAERDGIDVTDLESGPRVRLFREFDPAAPRLSDGVPPHVLDVPDPWYGTEEGFASTLQAVEAAADGLVEHIAEELANR